MECRFHTERLGVPVIWAQIAGMALILQFTVLY